MKASTMLKVGLAGLFLGVTGFVFDVRWVGICGVLLGAGAIFLGAMFSLAGKLENDL